MLYFSETSQIIPHATGHQNTEWYFWKEWITCLFGNITSVVAYLFGSLGLVCHLCETGA